MTGLINLDLASEVKVWDVPLIIIFKSFQIRVLIVITVMVASDCHDRLVFHVLLLE